MFRLTTVFRKVNPYSLFMKETRNHPALKKLNGPKRCITLSKLYAKLSPVERSSLQKRALNTTFKRKAKRVVAPKKKQNRQPTKYNIFVQKQMELLASSGLTPRNRVVQIAKAWRSKLRAAKLAKRK